jgi:hypothetical protein
MMTFGQRFMLLFSLFFFFGGLLFAMADFGGKKTAAILTGAPQSVLHYPDELTTAQNTVPCYTGAHYEQFIGQRMQAAQYELAAEGDLADGDRMEIYARPNGDYFVIVKGPDKTGAMEGCEVTQGWTYHNVARDGTATPENEMPATKPADSDDSAPPAEESPGDNDATTGGLQTVPATEPPPPASAGTTDSPSEDQ